MPATAPKTANDTPFSHITVKPLHSTFAAEISGVDFTATLSDEVFSEIHQAVTKVRPRSLPFIICYSGNRTNWVAILQYGVVVFRSTGLNDEGHIGFSRKFGELDDVTKAGGIK